MLGFEIFAENEIGLSAPANLHRLFSETLAATLDLCPKGNFGNGAQADLAGGGWNDLNGRDILGQYKLLLRGNIGEREENELVFHIKRVCYPTASQASSAPFCPVCLVA